MTPNIPGATQHASTEDISQLPSKENKVGVGVIQEYAPKYNPGRWNDIDVIRRLNNCYNYADQKITNSFAQPGYASGCFPCEIIEGLLRDGLVVMHVDPSGRCPEAPPQPNCLIAVFLAEGRRVITSA